MPWADLCLSKCICWYPKPRTSECHVFIEKGFKEVIQIKRGHKHESVFNLTGNFTRRENWTQRDTRHMYMQRKDHMLLLLLSRFSHVWLCDPIDSRPPGSPVPGILQARTLEWAAISFSNAWKWKVKVKSLSRVLLLATPWTAAYPAPPFMGFSRQEYWSGLPLPSAKSICKHNKNLVSANQEEIKSADALPWFSSLQSYEKINFCLNLCYFVMAVLAS